MRRLRLPLTALLMGASLLLASCTLEQAPAVPKPDPTHAAASSQGLRAAPLAPKNGARGCGSILLLEHRGSGNDRVRLLSVDPRTGADTELKKFETSGFSSARWSPGAGLIAFTATTRRSSDAQDLFVARADGSGLRRLTKGSNVAPPVTWAPDESRIAYGDLTSDSIVVVDMRGRQRVLGEGAAPEWSPDGRWIAYNATSSEGRTAAMLMTPDGEQRPLLATPSRSATAVAGWSPSSEEVLVVEKSDPTPRLVRVALDGGMSRIPTARAAEIADARWSPDGGWVAVSHKADEQGFIEVVAAAGGGEDARRLLPGSCCYEDADWAPDGRRLVVESRGGVAVTEIGSRRSRVIGGEAFPFVAEPDWAPC